MIEKSRKVTSNPQDYHDMDIPDRFTYKQNRNTNGDCR